MKKFIYSCLLTAALSALPLANAMAQTALQDSLKTDTLSFSMKNSLGECNIKAEIPTDAKAKLTPVIMKGIGEALGCTDQTAVSDPVRLLSEAGIKTFRYLNSEAQDAVNAGATLYAPYFYSAEIKKVYETDTVATYTSTAYTFLGGAHGMTVFIPVTYFKVDGSKIGYDIFKDKNGKALKACIIAGLQKYFDVKEAKDLKEYLLDISNIKKIPLPKTPPYLTKDGITLLYQSYEIAPYAAGTPSITIPYSEAGDLLTTEAADKLGL